MFLLDLRHLENVRPTKNHIAKNGILIVPGGHSKLNILPREKGCRSTLVDLRLLRYCSKNEEKPGNRRKDLSMKNIWLVTLVLLSVSAHGEPFAGLLSDDFEGASYTQGVPLPSPPWSPVVGNVASEVVVVDGGNQAARLSSQTPLNQNNGGWWQISDYPAPECRSVEISFDARVDDNGLDDSGAISLGALTADGKFFSLSLKRTPAGTANLVANLTGTDAAVSDVLLASDLSYGSWHSIKAGTTASVPGWRITLNGELLGIQPQTQRGPFNTVDEFIVLGRTFGGAAGTGTEGFLDNIVLRPSDADADGDGIMDCMDNCLAVTNVNQLDTNGDGFGNRCDADFNNDCVVNVVDLGVLRADFFSNGPDTDLNGDGVVNVIDLGMLRSMFFAAPGPSGITTCEP